MDSKSGSDKLGFTEIPGNINIDYKLMGGYSENGDSNAKLY